MHTVERPRPAEKMLGYGGLLLALAGSIGILYLSEMVTDDGSGPVGPVAVGLVAPILISTALALIPATRDTSLTWLVTGTYTGFLAALTIWSVGIVFLIAAVLLLAAFLTANWGN